MWGKDPTSFFCTWLSCCPCSVCEKSTAHRCMDFSLNTVPTLHSKSRCAESEAWETVSHLWFVPRTLTSYSPLPIKEQRDTAWAAAFPTVHTPPQHSLSLSLRRQQGRHSHKLLRLCNLLRRRTQWFQRCIPIRLYVKHLTGLSDGKMDCHSGTEQILEQFKFKWLYWSMAILSIIKQVVPEQLM